VHDLRNAFEDNRADNFTAILLRLIAKADSGNKEKLARGYPVEVAAVNIYRNDCPYTADQKVDWEMIERLAFAKVHQPSDEEVCEKYGWKMECRSPFEIRHEDGSFATGQSADVVVWHLRERYKEEMNI
jgi:hypothetical protein